MRLSAAFRNAALLRAGRVAVSGKLGVLRAGYAAVILLLVLSAFEAYRTQAKLSQQHLNIFREQVEQDAALNTLRRSLWSAGNYVRDFFIRTTPEQAETLRQQLAGLWRDDDHALMQIERTRRGKQAAAKLRQSLAEFWTVLERAPAMLEDDNEREFAFLQREIVPRRGELSAVLQDLADAQAQRVRQTEEEFARTRRSAALRLTVMLGMGVIIGFVVARLSLRHTAVLEKRAAAHHAEVEAARAQLQQLSVRLLEVEEEGRRRLSRELHDEIGQTLAVLQMEISHAQRILAPGAAAERLKRARELAERTVQTIRNLSVKLRPAMLDDLGLVPALQYQVEEFSRRSGIECEFLEEGVADRLADAVKTCVYRVVQEALHNAEKHSGADRVRVSVRQGADVLVAEVEDNGRGFAAVAGQGLGLVGCRERAAAVGGTWAIDSAPGRGTRMLLSVPVAPAAREVSAEWR